MHTPLSAWLALSAAIIPGATAFYPYHYVADGDSSSQPSRRTFRPASNDNARPITLPLRRIATNLQSRENVYQIVASNKPSQENSVAIDQDGKDLSYMVAVTFGDSKEEYHMLLDSAASNTWVMGQDCKSEACKTHNLFGTGDSSSLKTDTSNFSITYGTGSSSGTLASDTIHLGSLSSPLTFGLATNVSDEFRAYPMDGILGIGRGSGSEGDIHAPQIMDVLSSNHLINAKLYGIHLSRAKDGLKDGELDLGEVNKNRFTGDINYIDCVPNDTGFWEIPLQGASVDGTDVGLSSASRTAIMDTGTSYILVPKDDAVAIHSKIKGQTQNGETFFVPCDTASVVQFGFNGQKYNISAADWIGDNVDKTKNLCRSNIVGRQTFGAEQWLVGDVFLKNVYSVFDFDKSRVGLGVKGDEAETTSTDSSSGSPSNSPTASGSRAAAAAAPTTTSTEKAPQDQRGGSGAATAVQTSSSSIVALVVAIAAISMYI